MSERCALYVRVSTEDQDLEGQQNELVTEAERRGWSVSKIYREKASAYGKVARIEYERLLKDAHSPDRKWNHILVWSIDSWSGDEKFTKAIESIWELESLGIYFHSLKEPSLDTPPDGGHDLGRDVLRALLPVIAAFESRRRSERVQVALREIREGRRQTRSGRPPGRPVRATTDKVERAFVLRQKGKSWTIVAKHVGLQIPTIRRAVAVYRGSGSSDQKG